MMGPIFACDGRDHLDRLLVAARRVGIEVRPAEDAVGRRAFRLRACGGLIRGSVWTLEAGRWAVSFGYGHPFNPLRWPADRRLLRGIGELFEANDASRPDPSDLA